MLHQWKQEYKIEHLPITSEAYTVIVIYLEARFVLCVRNPEQNILFLVTSIRLIIEKKPQKNNIYIYIHFCIQPPVVLI